MLNPYKRFPYLSFFVIPVLLLILSAWFATHVELGQDFKGGMVVTLTINQDVDAYNIKQALMSKGFSVNSVNVYDTPVGKRLEITLSVKGEVEQANTLKNHVLTLLKQKAVAIQRGQNVSFDDIMAEVRTLAQLSHLNVSDNMTLRQVQEFVIEASDKVLEDYKTRLTEQLSSLISFSSISINHITPSLGKHFLNKVMWVFFTAAVLAVLVVFFIFRSWAPALAVLIGATSDVLFALGFMGFAHIPLTLPSFSALIMLLGFSLDTDVLLTMRLTKTRGDKADVAFETMKTGLTMTTTALFAFSVLFIISLFTHITFYKEVSVVALAGLVGDVIATWGINAPLLLLLLEGKR